MPSDKSERVQLFGAGKSHKTTEDVDNESENDKDSIIISHYCFSSIIIINNT